ncbi:type II secretion system inner membrane protein GspF [Plesiomonas shigelloides]|uniref:type II secretion system inner membrane protein GspF n=1 Tax=Plesiomonas shigelloides TaxID=703 RepID=UPI001261B244|nr:type II secretion system inner membrane protein GspF [Plesiomonas shigelloides]KAB7696437.1 type II secretion system protein GspF [Plesiomonas shigelloides]
MALFRYQALTAAGRTRKGMTEADSPRHARQLLRAQDLLPVEVWAVDTPAAAPRSTTVGHAAGSPTTGKRTASARRWLQRRVSSADLALLTRQLATLVQAAMPLEECLQAVSEQCEKLHIKTLVLSLRARIQEGFTLSDSLREHPQVFDSLFCSMVAAGEKSSHLERVLLRLADYTEQKQLMKSRLLQAMLYPLMLTLVAIGVIGILLSSVVPKVVAQFEHLGQALPASTRLLMSLSDGVQVAGLPLLISLLALVVLMQRLLHKPALRLRWDRFILRLPVIGRVSRGLNTARFARTLSILTASRIPVLDGVRIAASVCANRHIEQQILSAAERIREGSSLRAALGELRLFPPMMLYMIASGERCGELEPMLAQAADNQDREFDTQVGIALGVFEPLLIVLMAGVVLFIVIAILQPMLQLNNMVGM